MTFLPNDPILISQFGYEIPARFVEQDGFMTVVDLRNQRVCIDNTSCIIELDYKEKLLNYFRETKKDNNYFKELYNYIVPTIKGL